MKKTLSKLYNMVTGYKPTTKKQREKSPFNARAAGDKLKERRKQQDDRLKQMFPDLNK